MPASGVTGSEHRYPSAAGTFLRIMGTVDYTRRLLGSGGGGEEEGRIEIRIRELNVPVSNGCIFLAFRRLSLFVSDLLVMCTVLRCYVKGIEVNFSALWKFISYFAVFMTIDITFGFMAFHAIVLLA